MEGENTRAGQLQSPTLPLRPYMDVEVTALCKHPGPLIAVD